MRDQSDREDVEKVKEFLSGDAAAFEFLFDKYRESIYRIAFRFVRNKEDALEVAQEVFLRVYSHLEKFKTDSKFFTWLYRIAVNRSIDFTRSKKTRHAQEVDPIVFESRAQTASARSIETDPTVLAEAKELDQRLAEAVGSLSDKHRTVFVLHAMENLSYKEIAQVMDSSLGTVMSRLFYARKKLQEALGRVGLAPRSAGGSEKRATGKNTEGTE